MNNLTPVETSPAVFKNFDDMEELDVGMSNCFHEIDDGFEGALRANPAKVYGRHAGWNFNSKVYFEAGRFHGEVWVYCSPRETISANSLKELMTATNEKYGYD